MSLKKFSDFSIVVPENQFSGEKIRIAKLLNKKIIVLNYRITDSKFKEEGVKNRLDIQLELNDEKYILFTGSNVLMKMIEQVSKESFPFETVITKEGEAYQFN